MPLILAVMLITVIVFIMWRMGIFSSMWDDLPTETKSPFADLTSQTPPIDCITVCDKLDQCDSPLFEHCMDLCPPFYSEALRSCVMEADCDLVKTDCFGGADKSTDCLSICKHVSMCDVMDFKSCATRCKSWNEEMLECISDSDCDSILNRCFTPDPYEDCIPFCQKLIDCRQMGLDMEVECREICIGLSRNAVECALNSSCEDIEPFCFGQNPKPLCTPYCEVLTECDFYELDDFDICMNDCQSEPDILIQCIARSDCFTLEFCYDNPNQMTDCEDYCAKLISCEYFDSWEYLDCWKECEYEPAETVWCVLEKSCEDIESVCMENPISGKCEAVCGPIVDCGLEDSMEECLSHCFDNWPEKGSQFFFDYPKISDQCLEFRCQEACSKLEGCGYHILDMGCIDQCNQYWSREKEACILESDCIEIESDCQ